jgi:hypothetical protein
VRTSERRRDRNCSGAERSDSHFHHYPICFAEPVRADSSCSTSSNCPSGIRIPPIPAMGEV